MAAVIRLKRRNNEEPSEALFVNYKRRKLDNGASKIESFPAILKFAGTTETQEEDILKHISKPTKVEAEDQFKKRITNITEKLRHENQLASKNNRFKVVNFYRSSNKNVEGTDDAAEPNYTLVDVEIDDYKDVSAQECKTSSTEPRYVYDLYYTSSDDLGDAVFNEFLSIYPLSDELFTGSYRDNGLKGSDIEDSDDSNDENNWRNDYPDESDLESINEDDMLNAVNKMALDSDNELSSDDGEEGFVYSVGSEDAGQEDIDENDARCYGKMYARFKARCKRLDDKVDHNFYCGDIDEED